METKMRRGRIAGVKRRRKLLILAAIIVTAVLVMVLLSGEKEPEYQGKKLSEWTGLIKPFAGNTQISYLDLRGRSTEEMEKAIRGMGTNALPCLVRWVGYEAPGWRRWMSQSCTNLPSFILKSRLGLWLREDRKTYRADAAQYALLSYGPEVLPWVKELSRIEEGQKRPVASRRAYLILAVIGHRYHGTGDRVTSWMVPGSESPNSRRGIDSLPGFEPLFGRDGKLQIH
jgi:hypothetical protein